MTAVMERPNGAAVVKCPRDRPACEVRGTLCTACSAELQEQLREHAGLPADDGRTGGQPLNDSQVSFCLRMSLGVACRDGLAFADAWEDATAEILATVPPRDTFGWAAVFEQHRGAFERAYLRRRARFAHARA
jgi:hypothetical protein